MTWFERLTGIEERDGEYVRSQLTVAGGVLSSKGNQQSYQCGNLAIPSLRELRQQVAAIMPTQGTPTTLREVVGNVQTFHCDPRNEQALFQVASQFNLLEMVGPQVTPERGVGCYECDLTQGPACAIAAGAGTIYRNYFVNIDGQLGQTAQRQIDCLADLGLALGNEQQELWSMQNGYALASLSGLRSISKRLANCDAQQVDELRALLRIGLQWQTQVTLPSALERVQLVSQAFCSALPVAYSSHPAGEWEAFARLVLEATYEATFAAALHNYQQTGCNKLYLTLIGGGAFGNSIDWIIAAIHRALQIYEYAGLDVAIVSYSRPRAELRSLIADWSA